MSEQNDVLLTEDDFSRLGANEIAYGRPFVQKEKVNLMLVAGNRRQLGVAPDCRTAIAADLKNDFELVSVH